MKTGSLTPKQKKLLDFMIEYTRDHGYAPSQSEVAKHFKFKSLGTVQNYLVRLERQGLLKKDWNAKRGIEVIRPEPLAEAVQLPLVGRVAAGRPIEAIQTHDHIEVPASMLRSGVHFVLKVKGDSMIDDGILEGDFVIIRKQAVAQNGQTVVALIDNEATIKKYYHHQGKVELHPANAHYKPLVIVEDTSDFKIEGVFVGLIRRTV